MIHRKKIKLTSESEFKTVFISISEKTQSSCLQFIRRYCIFSGYYRPCLASCYGIFLVINGHWYSSAHVNHGVVTEEIIKGFKVGAVWGPLDLSFAADDAAPTLCVEEPHDFRHCVACSAIPVAVLSWNFQSIIHM